MDSRTPYNNSATRRFGTTPILSTLCKCVHYPLWTLLSSVLLVCSCLLFCREGKNFEHWVQWGWMNKIFWVITTSIISSTMMDSACLTLWSLKNLYTIFNNSVPIEQCIAIIKTTVIMLLMKAYIHTHTHTHNM